MLETITQELYLLNEKIAQKVKIKERIETLKNEEAFLTRESEHSKQLLEKEQADVDKLEGVSFASVYYSVTGKKEEQLSREKGEARAASQKYDELTAKLTRIKEEIDETMNVLSNLSVSEKEYNVLLNRKFEFIRTDNPAAFTDIESLKEKIQHLSQQEKESHEAYSIGVTLQNKLEIIKNSLSSAEDWGTWDLFGGGLISDFAKHSHLEDAQIQMQEVQSLIKRYESELKDIKIHSEMQPNIDTFLVFADFFFDGLFADWTVLNRIRDSKAQVLTTEEQIFRIQKQLQLMEREIQKKMQELQEEFKDRIVNY